jgi:hypothetical protein
MLRRFARTLLGEETPEGRLLREHVVHIADVLPAARRAAIRRLAEEKLANGVGENYAVIFSERHGDEYAIDPAVILHLLASPMMGILQRHFRRRCGTSEFILSLPQVVVRRFDPLNARHGEITIPFHQDAAVLPGGFAMVNCWTLLSPEECGEEAPGIEFLRGGYDRVIERDAAPVSPDYGFLETDRRTIDAMLARGLSWRPSIRLGDVLAFDEMMLHRTSLAGTKPRISAELRVFANTHLVKHHFARHPAPLYTFSGRSMTGPAVVRRSDKGEFTTVESRDWLIA